MQQILVVDDDPGVRDLVARHLRAKGWGVVEAADGEEALAMATGSDVDLVVLDIALPKRDGLDVLTELRATSDIPVILLTGHAAEGDRVLGLEQGADDYVVKPFSPRELEARVRTILRRAGPPARTDVLEFPGLRIDVSSREVHVDGGSVDLTAREFDLLVFLATNPRRVVSRDELLSKVWGSSGDWQAPATVTEHVRRLRLKLGLGPDEWIATVRGIGYRFEPH